MPNARFGCMIGAIAMVAGLFALAGPLAAQTYPERAIRVIVPFAPGGRTDVITRQFQRVIEQRRLLPQAIAVVNIDGGGGTVGGQQAKDSQADGYTLLSWHVGMITSFVLEKMNYGPADFVPVAETGTACYIWTASPRSGLRTFEDALRAARARPNTVIEATSISSAAHFASMLFTQQLGVQLRYVESGGTARRIQMLLGGHAQVGLFSTSDFVALRDQGLSALMTMAPSRLPDMPDVPTLRELGYDLEWCSGNWWFAPRATPADRIAVITRALQLASETPEIQQFYRTGQVIPSFLDGPGLARQVQQDLERLRALAPLVQ